MLAMASSRAAPVLSMLGSLKLAPPGASPALCGVGVAGTAGSELLVWAGAGGAAGVAAGAAAGVAGGALEDAAAADAGAAFGYSGRQSQRDVNGNRRKQVLNGAVQSRTHLTLLTTHTTNPFSSILYDSTVSSSLRILPGEIIRCCVLRDPIYGRLGREPDQSWAHLSRSASAVWDPILALPRSFA